MFSVNGVIALQPKWRRTTIAPPSAAMTANARQAPVASPPLTASIMVPA